MSKEIKSELFEASRRTYMRISTETVSSDSVNHLLRRADRKPFGELLDHLNGYFSGDFYLTGQVMNRLAKRKTYRHLGILHVAHSGGFKMLSNKLDSGKLHIRDLEFDVREPDWELDSAIEAGYKIDVVQHPISKVIPMLRARPIDIHLILKGKFEETRRSTFERLKEDFRSVGA